MPDEKDGPFGRIAPEWIVLTDVQFWIEQRFGVKPSAHVMQDLFSLIRQDTSDDIFAIPDPRIVRHRVKGLTAAHVRSRGKIRNFETRIQDPPGLQISRYDAGQVTVASWDEAKFDSATFTVAGLWNRSTATRVRHKIEVCWLDIERWVARNRIDSFRPATGNQPDAAGIAAVGFCRPDRVAVPTPAAVTQEANTTVQTDTVYKSGMQGRPTSLSLIAGELERRRAAGEVQATQAEEAAALAAWLTDAHPEAPKASPKTIRNSLGPKLREAVIEATARKERPK